MTRAQEQRGGSYRRPMKKNSSSDCSNPLLETISAIENIDSDEYCEGISPRPSPQHGGKRQGEDRDSIGYAGSNSIDSGYKSSCPTPDLLDGFYGSLPWKEGGEARFISKALTFSS